MKTLIQITEQTICTHKFDALRSSYNSERALHCRNCDSYDKPCYVPFKPNGEPVRAGRTAFILMKYGGRV